MANKGRESCVEEERNLPETAQFLPCFYWGIANVKGHGRRGAIMARIHGKIKLGSSIRFNTIHLTSLVHITGDIRYLRDFVPVYQHLDGFVSAGRLS